MRPTFCPEEHLDGNDDTADVAGHGTVIASVIAAPAGNGGYVGIAPEAKVLPVKVLGGSAGRDWSDGAVVRGIEFALDEGAKVINLSIGGLNTPIVGIEKALTDAQRAGALVVIAAGNDGVDLDDPRYTESPDGYGLSNTLTVANFTTRNTLATDSNYGARHVQIASLGTVLWGDYPGNTTGGYLGGSSAAAAATSGVAALLFAADPSATAGEVSRAIIVGANTDVQPLRGKVEANGLLSATGALAALARPDTTLPSAFKATGPDFTFRSRGPRPRSSRGSRRATRSSRATRSPLTGARRFCRRTQRPSGRRFVLGCIAGGCPPTTSRVTARLHATLLLAFAR